MLSKSAVSVAACVCALVAAASLQAREASSIDVSIDAQPLSTALMQFGRQSGLQVAFNPAEVKSKRAQAVRGQLDAERALTILLGESGLVARRISANALVIEESPSARPVQAQAFLRTRRAVPSETAPAAAPAEQAGGGGAPSDPLSEVVVTGSYIRSESFQPSSPVDTLTREDFDLRAPTTMAEFLADLPYNVNGAVLPGGRGAGSSPSSGSVNLRNLGEGATLVLLNSRRQTKLARSAEIVDLNSLVPQIMIERVEVLKDGASALYGSDAVGGVVNLMTRDRFTGFEVRGQGNWMTHSGKGEGRFGALWGGEWEDTRLVAGLEYNTRAMAYVDDVKSSDDFVFLSGPWQPASYVVPRRNAAGALIPGTTTVNDVGCGEIVQTYVVGTRCLYDFWPDNARINEETRYQGMMRATHEFSRALQVTGEIGFSRANIYSTTSSSGSISVTPGITIPGHNPGVAEADADRIAAGLPVAFRARNAAGVPLFALPSVAGSNVPLRDVNGAVVLSADPTNPASGIPFYEDVVFQGRIIGSQGGLPTQNQLGSGEYVRDRPSETHQNTFRTSVVAAGEFGDGWNWESGFLRSGLQDDTTGLRNNVLIRELRLAMAGFGGADCNPLLPGALPGQGNCQYFNPFTNSTFTTPDAANANTQGLVDWLMPAIWDHYETELVTYDAHVTGELFDVPAGAVALAAGVQHRAEKWKADFDSQKNTGNIESGGSFQDSDVRQSARAAFLELVAPVFDSERAGRLQANGAVRYENLGGGVDTIDPKIGLLYTSPTSFLELRGSWGTSFLAPNLFQRFTQSTGLANISDRGPGGTGEATRRITTITRGNPTLEPQESESYSLGMAIKPLPRLSLDLTYWNYDFRKLITLENVQALVNQNDPSKVIRDENGAVIFVVPSYVNLAGLQTSGFDFEARYGFDLGSAGSLTSTLMATYVDELRVPVPGGGTANVPDSRNSTVTGAPASVDWRGLARLQWELANHSAGLSVRYTDSYKNDSTLVPPGVVVPPDNGTVDSFASLDVSYTYTFDEGFLGINRSSVSLGALNVLESRVPRTADTVTLPFNDMRGRVAWMRLTANF